MHFALVRFRPCLISAAAGLFLAAVLLLNGCAVASVAGDIGGTAVDTTQKLFTAGKADTFVRAPWQETVAALRQAAGELALSQTRESPHPEQRQLVYHDDRGQEITITVIRRTAAATEIRVDVGLFGPENLGRLMLQQILRDLPGAAEHKNPTTSARDQP